MNLVSQSFVPLLDSGRFVGHGLNAAETQDEDQSLMKIMENDVLENGTKLENLEEEDVFNGQPGSADVGLDDSNDIPVEVADEDDGLGVRNAVCDEEDVDEDFDVTLPYSVPNIAVEDENTEETLHNQDLGNLVEDEERFVKVLESTQRQEPRLVDRTAIQPFTKLQRSKKIRKVVLQPAYLKRDRMYKIFTC